MTPEERQAAIDNISPEDLKKIESIKGNKPRVEIEDLIAAEFALKFGWEAYKEYRDDVITGTEMMNLLTASRKLDSLQQYQDAQAAFIGAASAKSRSPAVTFNKITSGLVRDAEADK